MVASDNLTRACAHVCAEIAPPLDAFYSLEEKSDGFSMYAYMYTVQQQHDQGEKKIFDGACPPVLAQEAFDFPCFSPGVDESAAVVNAVTASEPYALRC